MVPIQLENPSSEYPAPSQKYSIKLIGKAVNWYTSGAGARTAYAVIIEMRPNDVKKKMRTKPNRFVMGRTPPTTMASISIA
jgi:hypothetical protein